MRFKRLLFSIALSLVANYALIMGVSFMSMLTAARAGQIYGDKNAGIFACHNFHGDLFYCSGSAFFIINPLLSIGLFAITSLGMNIIVPTALFYFLHKRMTRGK